MAVDQEILEAFQEESRDHLSNVEDDILALERGDVEADTVNDLFRSLHTVKGASGFVGLDQITDLSHALENVVGRLRSGDLSPGSEVVEALLEGVDRLKILIADPTGDHSDDSETITALEMLSAAESHPAGEADPTDSAPPEGPGPAASSNSSPGAESNVKIPLALLDKLMNLATELVLVRNQNMQAVETGDRQQLMATAQRLNVVTSDLQSSVMRTRMRPVGIVFSRFTRIVRDFARALDKNVDIEITGADVELDKSIVEAIGDPLTHLLRNAVAHGIESRDARKAAGKSARGVVRLSAFHQSGQVHIRVQDDGAGMDPDALRESAISRGLVTRADASEMADRDALKLIFLPGFSTAAEVTDHSGRGVGMDVVTTGFKGLGGVVEITSRPGEGTTFTIKLPLTLAIVPALVVAVEGLCFAVPQVNIDEVVWLHGTDVYQSLKRVDDQEVYWLRNRLLPILRLSRLLDISKTYREPESGEDLPERREQAPDRRSDTTPVWSNQRAGPVERRTSVLNSVFILVIRVGEERYGLLVDTILDTEEIVVKSLHGQLKSSCAYAGTTVLGDGRIAMILDVAGIAELGSVQFVKTKEDAAPVGSSRLERQTLLLFDIGRNERFGVPLGLVSRVEEIKSNEIQLAAGREYLDYLGHPMPLVRLESALPGTGATYRSDLLYVIVPRGRRNVGVLAANILDTVILETEFDEEAVTNPEVLGSMLIDGHLTLLLDLYRVLRTTQAEEVGEGDGDDGGTRRILLAEDSRFFAALIGPYLRAAGIEVVHVLDGQAALERIQSEEFSILVSDIEMPRMNGLELARRVRADKRFRDLPLVAISALRDPSLDLETKAAGFDRFVSKLNQGNLLRTLESLCAGRSPVREVQA